MSFYPLLTRGWMDITWISNSNLHWLEWGTLVVLWLFSCHSFPVPMDQRSNKRCPQRIPFKSRPSCLCSGEATQLLSHHQDWSQQPRAPCLPVGLVAEEVPKGQGAILASNVSDPLLCFLVDAFLLWTLQPLSPSSQSRRDEKQILFGKIMIGPLPPSPIGYWVCVLHLLAMAVSAHVLVVCLRHLAPSPSRQNPNFTGCCLLAGAMTEPSGDHSAFPPRQLLLGDETHDETNEFQYWGACSILKGYFTYHKLTPSQGDSVIMDKGKIVQAVKTWWKGFSVMNLLQIGLLVPSRNGATSGPLPGILALTRDTNTFTLRAHSLRPYVYLFPDLTITW